jgi:hypothetical protein
MEDDWSLERYYIQTYRPAPSLPPKRFNLSLKKSQQRNGDKKTVVESPPFVISLSDGSSNAQSVSPEDSNQTPTAFQWSTPSFRKDKPSLQQEVDERKKNDTSEDTATHSNRDYYSKPSALQLSDDDFEEDFESNSDASNEEPVKHTAKNMDYDSDFEEELPLQLPPKHSKDALLHK